MPLVSFYTLWKYQNTSDVLMFSWDIERDQRDVMGYKTLELKLDL